MGAPPQTHTYTLLHHSVNTWEEGGENSTNPNMPQCWRPSKGVAAKMWGLANHGRQHICCPIRASGTSGTSEQQSSTSWTLTFPTWLHRLPFSSPLHFFFHSFCRPVNLSLYFSHRWAVCLRSDRLGAVGCLDQFICISQWYQTFLFYLSAINCIQSEGGEALCRDGLLIHSSIVHSPLRTQRSVYVYVNWRRPTQQLHCW